MKPSVLRGLHTDRFATFGFAKTADAVGDAERIGEVVLMSALHGDALIQVGDGVAAGAAEEAFFSFGFYIALGLEWPRRFSSFFAIIQ